VIYELKVGGVDAGRLIGAKLEKLPAGESAESKGKPTEGRSWRKCKAGNLL
ncbi:hypothetical protein MKW98_026595, partial [Papaver atlanticum]